MMTKMLNFAKSGTASRAKHFFSEYIKTSSNPNKNPAHLVWRDAFLHLQANKDNVRSESPLQRKGSPILGLAQKRKSSWLQGGPAKYEKQTDIEHITAWIRQFQGRFEEHWLQLMAYL